MEIDRRSPHAMLSNQSSNPGSICLGELTQLIGLEAIRAVLNYCNRRSCIGLIGHDRLYRTILDNDSQALAQIVGRIGSPRARG